jgi:DNA (cytosine-5)-methyltransferase 1
LDQLTFLSEEPPVNPSQLQDSERDWQTRVATSCSPSLRLLADIGPDGWFGRTSPASYHPTEERIFASLLRGLAELGYGWSYRVLDAQFFGVAQRRRRVFVVGYLGDWHPAAAVLLERSSLSGHPAPSRKKREGATPSPVPGVANCLTNRMHKGINTTVDEGQTPIIELPEVMCTLRSSGAGFDRPGNASTEHETYIPTAYSIREDAIADNFSATPLEVSTALQSLRPSTQSHHAQVFIAEMAVRRLTPRECERLQGFPDDYTAIPWRGKKAPDGPRYKALGNSMAVPVMRWIGKRIQQVEKILDER